VILINMDVTEQPNLLYAQRPFYPEAVAQAGGLALLVPPLSHDDALQQALSTAGGVVLTGALDVDPALYGRERHEKTVLMHRRREKFDIELARRAYERDIPMLAICGGFQELAVALGGTLIQHIPASVEGALTHFPPGYDAVYHDVEIDCKSLLFSIVGTGLLRTNSFHHQALEAVPSCLRVSARAADGVVEAYEDTGKRFCLGVQWHPERMQETPEHAALFRALVEAAALKST
jgi:putative glutamine amidotransferase